MLLLALHHIAIRNFYKAEDVSCLYSLLNLNQGVASVRFTLKSFKFAFLSVCVLAQARSDRYSCVVSIRNIEALCTTTSDQIAS